MLRKLEKYFHRFFFSKNIFSFIFSCYLISKAYDIAPAFYFRLSKQLKFTGRLSSTNDELKHFGRFELPLAKSMFFRDTRISCLHHTEQSCASEDCLKKNLRDLFDLIRAAQKEILLCCYNFTYLELAQVFIEAYDQNVTVRVIANFESVAKDGAVQVLQKKGIRIKMQDSTYIFHHKFIILDRTVLINGSTNFTEKGIFGNIDSLLVTSDPFFVEKYAEEFEFLWNSFELTF